MSTHTPPNAGPNARRGHLPPVPAAPAVDAARLIAEVAVLRKQMDARIQAEKKMAADMTEQRALTKLMRGKHVQDQVKLFDMDRRVTRATEYALGGLLIGTLAMLVAVALTFGWL